MSKLARFARPKGAKDKKKRKSNLLRNIAIGAGGTALLSSAAYLGRGKIAGLMSKGKPKPGVTKVPYSQLSKEELLSMGGKGRINARKAVVSRTSQKDDLKYGVTPNSVDDFENINAINNAINTNRPGFTKEMLRKMKKEKAVRIKAYADRLRKEGAYYSSSSQTTNFHESTMMSLASFNRKWK
jgi:predicted site-specific integrase-resolvase